MFVVDAAGSMFVGTKGATDGSGVKATGATMAGAGSGNDPSAGDATGAASMEVDVAANGSTCVEPAWGSMRAAGAITGAVVGAGPSA